MSIRDRIPHPASLHYVVTSKLFTCDIANCAAPMALVLNLPMSLRTGRFDSYYRTKIQAQKRFDFMEQTVEEAKKWSTIFA